MPGGAAGGSSGPERGAGPQGGRKGRAGAAGAREPRPRHPRPSLAAEEGKRGTGRPRPPRRGLAPASCPPPIGRARRPGASPLAVAVLDTKFKVFKKRPARAGFIHCPRRRRRSPAGERGAGSELRREPLCGRGAPRPGLRSRAGSGAAGLRGQGFLAGVAGAAGVRGGGTVRMLAAVPDGRGKGIPGGRPVPLLS